jgi:hypothetical protein
MSIFENLKDKISNGLSYARERPGKTILIAAGTIGMIAVAVVAAKRSRSNVLSIEGNTTTDPSMGHLIPDVGTKSKRTPRLTMAKIREHNEAIFWEDINKGGPESIALWDEYLRRQDMYPDLYSSTSLNNDKVGSLR